MQNVQAHPLGGVAGDSNEASERALGAVAARSVGAKTVALLVALIWQLAATVTCAVETGEAMLLQSPTELGAAPLFGLLCFVVIAFAALRRGRWSEIIMLVGSLAMLCRIALGLYETRGRGWIWSPAKHAMSASRDSEAGRPKAGDLRAVTQSQFVPRVQATSEGRLPQSSSSLPRPAVQSSESDRPR